MSLAAPQDHAKWLRGPWKFGTHRAEDHGNSNMIIGRRRESLIWPHDDRKLIKKAPIIGDSEA